MGAKDENNVNDLLQKFEKVLSLLNKYCEKSKSSFSENISFLLDKSLDHLKQLDIEDAKGSHTCDDVIHTSLIQNRNVKHFFDEVLKVSKASNIHTSILTFAIDLLTQLTRNENRFQLMYAESPNIFVQVRQLTETTVIEGSEFKQSILNLFLSLAKFKAGQNWLLNSGTLLFIIESLSDRTVFTRKTAQEVMITILPQLDETPREDVLKNLLKPIHNAGNKLENNQIESDKLKPYFEVLESCVELSLISGKQSDKIGASLLSLSADITLHKIASNAQIEQLLIRAGSLLVAIYAKGALECENERIALEAKTSTLVQLILRRGFLRSTLSVTSQSLYFWRHLKTASSFQAQLVHLMIVPILFGTEDTAQHFPGYGDICEYWKNLADDTTKSLSNTLSLMLHSTNELNELTNISLAGLQKSMDKLGKESVLKVTRSGLFLLGCLKVPDAKRTLTSFTPQLIINLIQSLCTFIDVYKIRWWETYETVCLPMIFTKIVAYYGSRDTNVTCAGLKGLKFCIQQFIHPDQALLTIDSQHSSLNGMADVIQQCTVSVYWEVRDSAMEVALEMAQLSQARYPEFQNLLIRSQLLEAALAAFNDTEAYVRASAVEVVAAASPVALLWENLTSHSDVISSCYSILLQDSEAMARRAAAKALTYITQAGHFPLDKDRTVLYRHMSHAAISDLDWEVKLHALEFWKVVIEDSLTQQGMLDGCFPEITFSKEKQKIVRLDAKEIRTRLQNALTELGACGCLNVLLHLADDCDAPVQEKSIQLLCYLRDILAKYRSLDLNVFQQVQFSTTDLLVQNNDKSSLSESETVLKDSNQVIEEILDVDDVTLVNSILTNKDPIPRPDPIPVSPVSAQDFLTKVNIMELETMLETTRMSSDLHVLDFESLLDDLQDCIHTDSSRPRPDCY